MTKEKQKNKKTSILYCLRLLHSVGIPKLVLGLGVLLSIIGSLTGLIVPLITGTLIDALGQGTFQWSNVVVLISLFILEALTGGLSYYMLAYVGNDVVYKIRKRLWKKILSLPIPFFDRHRSAELMSRVSNDTDEMHTLITDHLISFASSLLTIFGGIAILFYLDWQMALIILVAGPIGALIIISIGDKMYQISLDLYEKLAELATLLTQVISEMRLVKASNAEGREEVDGYGKMKSLFQFGIKEAKINAVLGPLLSMVMALLLVIIIGYGGVRVSSGALSAGELVAFILLLFQITIPFTQFATFYTKLQKVLGATERLRVILDHPIEGGQRTELIPLAKNEDLHFNNITFSYVEKEPVLREVSFVIPAGKMTAFVGPSGSGKTTILSLIEQFYHPEKGTITYGESRIADFPLRAWRKKIGYVSQESSLMSGSIRDNIVYGCEGDVPDHDVMEAAKQAYAHQFIESLPHGYDTEVGERGIQLSGGQRQRVAIARAFLRQPDLLLLDEATASLDSDSEHEVQKALAHLMLDRTTIVIAHRLSTVVKADQIIVIEKGDVTGAGTHEELLGHHAAYDNWAKKQLQVNI
ncbi:ABC transporter ATP-binding protein [Paenibacillaceae bacterium]|nr:ABC transporter ATP-binding protein [Paenibacillaceae bacterium]